MDLSDDLRDIPSLLRIPLEENFAGRDIWGGRTAQGNDAWRLFLNLTAASSVGEMVKYRLLLAQGDSTFQLAVEGSTLPLEEAFPFLLSHMLVAPRAWHVRSRGQTATVSTHKDRPQRLRDIKIGGWLRVEDDFTHPSPWGHQQLPRFHTWLADWPGEVLDLECQPGPLWPGCPLCAKGYGN